MNKVDQAFADRYIRLLLQWRWPVLILGAVVGATLALIDHGWDFGHGELEFINAELLVEWLVYGVAAPTAAWLLMTGVAYNMRRRVQAETEKYYRQLFSNHLARHLEWHELTRFVTHFIGTRLDLAQTALELYDHRRAGFDLGSAWSASGALPPPRSLPHAHYDESLAMPALHSHPAAGGRTAKVVTAPGGEYCLPLLHDQLLLGVLRLSCHPSQLLRPSDVNFLNSTGPELALAMVAAIARQKEIALVRTATQLAERRQLAYNLHASLTQQIGFLRFGLGRLAADEQLQSGNGVGQQLADMRQVSQELYEQMRDFLTILYAGNQTDLAQLIESFVQRVVRQTGLEIELTIKGDVGLVPTDLSWAIFGLAQEGLNNIVKHARARTVHVGLHCAPGGVGLALVDDGVGFDPTAEPPAGHFGMHMMQDRVAEMLGRMAVTSQLGQGTTLDFWIPLGPAESDLSGTHWSTAEMDQPGAYVDPAANSYWPDPPAKGAE